MVEDDTFTNHVKQPPRENINTAQLGASVHALISRERTQKLDLLLHLLSNLTQSLVVCGPKGIGKTMLLTLLQERNTELFRYCLMQGNADVSFEAMQEQLANTLAVKSVPSLSAVLGQYEGQHKQVVLIVDNAGDLVPGLITAIIHYAAANPVLRVIFALTHDELQVKRGSDKAVDDCHIVEIPTLSEKQCGDFLRHLSTKAGLNLSFKAISENMIAHIYRKTHGVPGRIIAELSRVPSARRGGALKWTFALFAVSLIIVAFGVQWQPWWRDSHKQVENLAVAKQEDVIKPTSQKTETPIPLPPPQAEVTLAPTVLEVAEKPNQAIDLSLAQIVEEQTVPFQETKAPQEHIQPMISVRSEVKPETKPAVVATQKIVEPVLLAQEKPKAISKPEPAMPLSANNYTLQLMVLSKQESVNGILKKYPTIKVGVKVIKTLVNGQEKFVLEYGAYPDAISANKARQSLPAEFQKAMVRKQGTR